MSQWFGGPDRKAGKSPGGAPEGSAGMSRGRSGRPLPRQAPPANHQQDDDADDFARPASVPPRERPGSQQPPAPQTAPPPNFQQQTPYQQPPQNFQQPQQNYQQPPQNYQTQNSQQPQFQQLPQYQQPQPQNTQNYQQQPNNQNNQSRRQSASQQYDDESYQEQGFQEADTPERIEFKKRLVALIFDFLACYILAMGVMLIPFINSFVSLTLVMCMFLLIRDYVFEGRGVGKNLMGLQVIDAETGAACSLRQSAMRNLVLIAPYALTQIVTAILRLIPFNGFNSVVSTVVWGLCAVYVIIVIPLEVYRAYTRPDGQRIGDELAGTEIIESAMDFSRPLPR